MRRMSWVGLLLLSACTVALGPEETHELRLSDLPDLQAISFKLTTVDRCQVTAGGSDAFAAQVTTNVPALAPLVQASEKVITVSQRLPMGRTLPAGASNRWDVTLGTSRPIKVEVVAASLPGVWRLGGLPLTGLDLSVGVAGPEIRFDQPNPVTAETLAVKAGAGELTLVGLGNANARNLQVEGGAGQVRLDFAGPLRATTYGDLAAGVGDWELRFPKGAAVKLNVSQAVGSVSVPADFQRHGEAYVSSAYQANSPHWELKLALGIGQVRVVMDGGATAPAGKPAPKP